MIAWLDPLGEACRIAASIIWSADMTLKAAWDPLTVELEFVREDVCISSSLDITMYSSFEGFRACVLEPLLPFGTEGPAIALPDTPEEFVGRELGVLIPISGPF